MDKVAFLPFGLLIDRWRWQVFNQHGTQVLDLEATSLFDLPPPDSPT